MSPFASLASAAAITAFLGDAARRLGLIFAALQHPAHAVPAPPSLGIAAMRVRVRRAIGISFPREPNTMADKPMTYLESLQPVAPFSI